MFLLGPAEPADVPREALMSSLLADPERRADISPGHARRDSRRGGVLRKATRCAFKTRRSREGRHRIGRGHLGAHGLDRVGYADERLPGTATMVGWRFIPHAVKYR